MLVELLFLMVFKILKIQIGRKHFYQSIKRRYYVIIQRPKVLIQKQELIQEKVSCALIKYQFILSMRSSLKWDIRLL